MGIFSKVGNSTQYIDSKSVLVFSAVGTIIIATIILFLMGFKPEIHINHHALFFDSKRTNHPKTRHRDIIRTNCDDFTRNLNFLFKSI